VKPDNAYQAAWETSQRKFQTLDPQTMARNSLCAFDVDAGHFVVKSLAQIIHIAYPNGDATWVNAGRLLPFDWSLILLNYLSRAKIVDTENQWVSFRELPQGNFFYRNLERTAFKELSDFYSACDKNLLRDAATRLGFSVVTMQADLTLAGNFAPRIPVRVQFWEGEDDLPASSQILFDRTVAEQLHIEDIAVLCGLIQRQLMKQYTATR
jgi:hypothetical protein